MFDIVITSQELEQLGDCQKLLCEIIKGQQHTQDNGRKIPQEVVDTWDKVEQLCDILCRHWKHGLEQKEGSTKMFNLFTSSKVQKSIESLQSALEQERKLEVALDDVRHKKQWEAKLKEDVPRGNEQICRYEMMKQCAHEEYHREWPFSPATEAYDALSTLLRLTKRKGWINNKELVPLMDDDELDEMVKMFDEHMQTIKDNVERAARTELDRATLPAREQILAMERDRNETLYGKTSRSEWEQKGD